jgi:NADH-quinone oxidoreductase subunit N
MFPYKSIFTPDILDSMSKFLPETILVAAILLVFIVELFFKKKTRVSGWIALVALIPAFIFTIGQTYYPPSLLFFGMVVVDPFSIFFKVLLLLSALLIILFSFLSDEVKNTEFKTQEYYALILCLTLGGFLMSSAVNLLMMYLSLELVSLSSYIMAGYFKKSKRSSEAALKYVIYGGVSSGLMLFGISLLYGMCGSTDIFAISIFLSTNPVNIVTLLISIFLVLAGFGYKISAVPFHFWTPDVYEGSPLPITALLSVSSKAAGFAMMIRFFIITFQNATSQMTTTDSVYTAYNILPGVHWNEVIAVIAVITMTLGNVVAIWQDNLKRLLAYSSIAQAGYILLAFAAVSPQGVSAMLIYLSVYLFMNLGAFLVAILISNKFGTESIEEMKGYGYRAPFLCVSMGVFMLSLSGIPATAGFIGKFYIFSALVNSGHIWLTLIGLLNSVISLYYYVKILKNMFLIRPADPTLVHYGAGYNILLLLLVIPTIVLGLYFAPLTRFAEYSMHMFGIR